MWVLDTSTLIYFFKAEGRVADVLLGKSPSDIGIPSLVLFELAVGIAKSSSPAKRSQQLDALTSSVNILGFGQKEALASAEIRAALEQDGRPIRPHDTLIAGTALANGGILVTRNTHEFARVKGLRLEDWY